ncbi:xanthine dehydrogenase family protein molybdopterin-binding subunit [Streptomyces sp. NPDC057271]
MGPEPSTDRFLRGSGSYVADLTPPGAKHLAFVRSPHAHARVHSVDLRRALAAPGVRAAFRAADLEAAGVGTVTHQMPTPPFQPLRWPLLAADKVRYVGDPVAVVVADDPYLAEDAAELVAVGYEVLPAISDPERALAEDAPLLYDEWGTNLFVSDAVRFGDLDAGFAAASGIIEESFEHHRVCGFPLEGNQVWAYRDRSGRLQICASTQFPHQFQAVVADLLGIPLPGIRVTVPDVGGGFGLKQHVTREELLTAALATLLPWPVRWGCDLAGTLEHGIHARRQRHAVRVGYGSEGELLAVEAHITADVGNPLLYFTGAGPALVTAGSLPGAYAVPAYACEVRAVATHTAPVGGFRGFGQPQAVFTMERVLDMVARRVGRDPADVRRRNLVPDAPRPYVSRTGQRYDIGSIRTQFDRLLGEVRHKRARDATESLGEQELYHGTGFACYIEPNAPNIHSLAGRYGAYETVTLTMQPDATIVACVGTKDIGQGNVAAFTSMISGELRVAPDRVTVRDGDTDLLPLGLGTMGSRSMVMVGEALRSACRQLRAALAGIAAHALEASAASVRFHQGACCSGDRRISYEDIAAIVYLRPYALPPDTAPGLLFTGVANASATDYFPNEAGELNVAATYSSSVGAAHVTVHPVSGEVTVTGFTVVYDCGEVIDPVNVQGQLQGSFAHGMSAVLFEDLVYESTGTARTPLSSYLVARSTDVPRVRSVHMGTRPDFGAGVRGVGQTATILAPAAIANAIEDALEPFGVTVRQTSLTPRSIRSMIRHVADSGPSRRRACPSNGPAVPSVVTERPAT